VIVGIDNAGAGRAREYLPWPDTFLDPPEPEPVGRRYVEFLRDQVMPAIEARFRIRRDPSGRALGGASYGALIAAYVAGADDALFDGLLLESPSFYVDDRRIFRFLADSGHSLSRVYLGVGTNELAVEGCGDHAWNREAVRDVRRMARLLAQSARGELPRDAPRIDVVVEECAVHGEAAWARRLPRALEVLFGR
jgi:predicted alpha/beta superfamily hydrolase